MRKKVVAALLFIACTGNVIGQNVVDGVFVYDLDGYITAALERSNEIKNAKSRYLSAYWDYRSYKASFLPSLNLRATLPEFKNTIDPYQDGGSVKYSPTNYITENLTLSIDQQVGFTGGKFSLESNIQRRDDFLAKTTTYKSLPIAVAYSQNLFGINWLKWQKQIDPIRYEEARRNYLFQKESVILSAISYFFDLAIAQQNLQIAKTNLNNADTLYKISQGRYRLGSISESDLMQMELTKLNAESALSQRLLDLEDRQNKFRSYLGINEKKDIKLIVPSKIPNMVLSYDKVLEQARLNNPDIVRFNRQILEAERWLEENKKQTGFSASLNAKIGFNQNSFEFVDSYKGLKPSQTASITISMPILDWGNRRGKIKMAESNLDLVKGQVEQSEIDFEQNIYFRVMRFNMMGQKYQIASKADTIAHMRYKVTMNRFIAGKISVLDLNTALNEKDNANSNFVYTMKDFWWFYYELRRVALYDFEKGSKLETDYDSLIR